jgi:glycosylphosphatidylinositol transamidase (GPIT) subunit GPI8
MANPYETLIQTCLNLEINIGDTFAWGCADAESIDSGDALDLIPFIEKYGDEAIVAFVSVKRELLEDSLESPMLLDKSYAKYFGKDVEEKRDNYRKARQEILNSIKNPDLDKFNEVSFEYKHKLEEEKKYGEKVKWKGVQLEGTKFYTQIAYLPKKNISATGVNMKEALDNLEKLVKE